MPSEQSLRQGGRLFLVVGPSGAGKDTLINAARDFLAGDSDYLFPARFVTRPSDTTEQTRFIAVDDFAVMEGEGAFALHWDAHGHRYGIGRDIEEPLLAGVHVVVNVSRATIAAARIRYPCAVVILVTASPEILRQRLSNRARETADEIVERSGRRVESFGEADADVVVDNSGAVEDGVAAFIDALLGLGNCAKSGKAIPSL